VRQPSFDTRTLIMSFAFRDPYLSFIIQDRHPRSPSSKIVIIRDHHPRSTSLILQDHYSRSSPSTTITQASINLDHKRGFILQPLINHDHQAFITQAPALRILSGMLTFHFLLSSFSIHGFVSTEELLLHCLLDHTSMAMDWFHRLFTSSK
jgi:hypothetical protein